MRIAGGRIIDSASGRYGYSFGFGVISSVNCSSCTDNDYCTIDDCQWSDSDDTQCLSHSRDAVVQCYNGIIVMISINVIVLVLQVLTAVLEMMCISTNPMKGFP